MKRTILAGVIAVLPLAIFAQEKDYTVLDGTTTGTKVTSSTKSTSTTANGKPTTGSSARETMARNFSAESFEKRWAMEEKMYKDAGIPADKIEKLKVVNEKFWKARASGENIDFQALRLERDGILSADEQKALRDYRNKAIRSQLNRNTTGTAN